MKEVTHDQEVNFNERFRGKKDTAKELQNHAAKKQKKNSGHVGRCG